MIYNIFTPSFARRVKQNFRPGRSFFLLLLFTALPLFAATGKGQSARKQVTAAVQEHAAQAIRQQAKRLRWVDYQAKMNLFVPSDVSRYAPCPTPLSVSLPGGERLDLNRLRFDVRCEGPQGWDVAVVVKPDIYLPVTIAKNTLDRGQVITASDVSLKKLNVSSLRGNFLTNPDEAIGLTVKRRIRELQPIALSQLESPVLVERGQRVLMIAEQGGVEARTTGEAMKKGRKGEIVKVKNESSERVVSAVVAEPGVVRMIYAGGR
ncbi:flagellar basal body P-ring formation chaperone FlgA [Intestinirhabdus alba]|jgi:flagella basal body P-ring formation protein FlgA|uniref:Flagella basal body P-ring formation protein FlgA n=1 Tax=Intestinirhabdus alba TaxID=2899544 RepID=A0A6L6IKB8_9ENTR|nr:flagellar basal body P-ring formation chaperone FlgA [Intestinirhabdus alba]MTH46158.1 flagellar basal body P-ring formation protein FlgA [Intestinirhabdus alba]